jgi:hypothetical protein
MVKRIAPVAVVSVVLLAACAAVCQNTPHQSADRFLPDAPSTRSATPPQKWNGFVEQERSPLKFAAAGGRAGMMPYGLSLSDRTAFSQKDPNAIFRKYLYPSAAALPSGYHSVSDAGLMHRATYAASRPLITRDYSGKARLNTSYILRTLTAVAKDTASTPYWKRSLAEPFSDFGSTVGNDAGMNLWHEFGPSIEQLMKSHTPKFVTRIEERVTHQ